jgi:hypothetical protein
VLYLASYEASKRFLGEKSGLEKYPTATHFISGIVAETVR